METMFNSVDMRVVHQMERARRIASYYSAIRAEIIGKSLPTLVVTKDESGNVRRIESHYSPEIEGVLHKLEEMERKDLEDVKNVKFVCW